MNHKPGSLEESAQRVLLGEVAEKEKMSASEAYDRAEKAVGTAYKNIEDFVEEELKVFTGDEDLDLIIAYNDIISYLSTSSALNDIMDDVTSNIKYNEEQDD